MFCKQQSFQNNALLCLTAEKKKKVLLKPPCYEKVIKHLEIGVSMEAAISELILLLLPQIS